MSVSAESGVFRQPIIRHLAWLCRAPQLYAGPLSFHPAEWLPADYLDTLLHWDRHPERWPDSLRQTPPRRLGHYFEQLYACVLEDLLGWELLGRNLQIRDQQRTLGELDFLVRNPHTDAVEHHEIAVKFYLGHLDADQVRWYGPNSRDRLDLKTDRLLQHQSRMAAQPAALPLLASLGLNTPPLPRLFMPGYLFYPLKADISAPDQAEPEHGRGRWCYLGEVSQLVQEGWVVLHKPHWLSHWQQPEAPESGRLQQAAEQVASSGRACLLARLAQNGDGWHEQERVFLLPESWPGVPSQG